MASLSAACAWLSPVAAAADDPALGLELGEARYRGLLGRPPAPGSLLATTVIGNCETLGMLCLLQAAAPGTPFIYAPVLAAIDPRSGRYGAGAIEGSLLGAACTEMARYYGLPAEASEARALSMAPIR